jgi:hypothetical protein
MKLAAAEAHSRRRSRGRPLGGLHHPVRLRRARRPGRRRSGLREARRPAWPGRIHERAETGPLRDRVLRERLKVSGKAAGLRSRPFPWPRVVVLVREPGLPERLAAYPPTTVLGHPNGARRIRMMPFRRSSSAQPPGRVAAARRAGGSFWRLQGRGRGRGLSQSVILRNACTRRHEEGPVVFVFPTTSGTPA